MQWCAHEQKSQVVAKNATTCETRVTSQVYQLANLNASITALSSQLHFWNEWSRCFRLFRLSPSHE